jgi:hypothetical protein
MYEAIVDAGLQKGDRVAVLVGMTTELETHRHRATVEGIVPSELHQVLSKKNNMLVTVLMSS